MIHEQREKNQTKQEIEDEEIRKLGEKPGIEDLMRLYGEYEQWMQITMQYLKEMDAKVIYSTTDSTETG